MVRPELPEHVRALYPFTSRWIEVGGHRLHYLHEGPRSGPFVVLLHGNPTWSFLYRDFVAPLVEAGHAVLVPDYLGFGLSDKPEDEGLYAIRHHVARLVALFDAVGVEQAVLFCQDWGGPIGLGAAVERPGMLAGLCLANTFWGEASDFHRSVGAWRAIHGPVAGPLLLGRRGMFVEALRLSGPPHPPQAVRDAYALPFAEAGSAVGTMAFPRAISLGEGHPTQPLADAILRALPTWDVPVRLPWGDADVVFPTGEQGARFAEVLPRATGVEPIAGARHFVQEYAAEACTAALLDVAREAFA